MHHYMSCARSPSLPSYTFRNDFIEMMEIMDKRLNDKGKNWRHVFKTLTLLDYLLHAGSENVVIYFRDNMYVVKTLREFQYIDEAGKDQGANGTWRRATGNPCCGGLTDTRTPLCSATKSKGHHQSLARRGSTARREARSLQHEGSHVWRAPARQRWL